MFHVSFPGKRLWNGNFHLGSWLRCALRIDTCWGVKEAGLDRGRRLDMKQFQQRLQHRDLWSWMALQPSLKLREGNEAFRTLQLQPLEANYPRARDLTLEEATLFSCSLVLVKGNCWSRGQGVPAGSGQPSVPLAAGEWALWS